MAQFSGEPVTLWKNDHRLMVLKEEFKYTNVDGREWLVPKGAELNGATIPKALWSRIGSPFVGKYRRASIIHDYYVGEGNNPDVDIHDRKAADEMFYEACRNDGCSPFFAKILYLGVCVGTWASSRVKKNRRSEEEYQEHPEDKMIQAKFDEALLTLESDFKIETLNFNDLDTKILEELFV